MKKVTVYNINKSVEMLSENDSTNLTSDEEVSIKKKPESSNKLRDMETEVIQKSAILRTTQTDVHLEIDDLDKVCRICLAEEEISSLHQSKDYPTFVFLLQSCYKSGIPIDNIYPSNICKVCSSQLQNISQFIKQLKDTTQQLNLLFESEYEIIENDSIESSKNITVCITDDEDDCNEMEHVEETIIIEEDIDGHILESRTDSPDTSPSFKGFRCEPCNRTFNYFTSWQCHMIRHEEINKNKCQFCDWISVDDQKYQEHLETAHNDLISDSKNKKSEFFFNDDSDSETKPKNLARLTIDGQLKCNNCEITFKNSIELNKHISTHLETIRIKCDICEKKYVDEFSLQLHLKTAHQNKDLSQIKKDTSKRERKFKEQPGEHACDACNKQFAFKSSRNRHVQIVHEQAKRFCCDICNEKFTVKNSLKYHMNIHTNSKPFECNLCSKAFRQPAALIRHQRTRHSSEKKFLCEVCLKAFKTSKGLENHSLQHIKGLI